MEQCDFDMANRAKVLLEEAQRYRRRQFEATKTRWTPAWFELRDDPTNPGRRAHQYKVSEGGGGQKPRGKLQLRARDERREKRRGRAYRSKAAGESKPAANDRSHACPQTTHLPFTSPFHHFTISGGILGGACLRL